MWVLFFILLVATNSAASDSSVHRPAWLREIYRDGEAAYLRSSQFTGKQHIPESRASSDVATNSDAQRSSRRAARSEDVSEVSIQPTPYGKGCFAISKGTEAQTRSFLDSDFFDPGIDSSAMTNFACVRRCSESGFATAVTFDGRYCRCGNSRLENSVSYSNCNSRCSGVMPPQIPDTPCTAAYCCGSGWNGTAIHVILSMVGVIPVEEIVGRQAASGLAQRYLEFSQRWATVTAATGADFTRWPLEGLGHIALVFQQTTGRSFNLDNTAGTLSPMKPGENVSYCWRPFDTPPGGAFQCFDFTEGADLSVVIGRDKTLACAMHTSHACIGGFSQDPVLHSYLWLVRTDGSYEVLVKYPTVPPGRIDPVRWVHVGLQLRRPDSFFRSHPGWSWNPQLPTRSFPKKILACEAVQALPSSSSDLGDHHLLFLADSLGQIWSAHVGTSYQPNGSRPLIEMHRPHLTGVNPRRLQDIWPVFKAPELAQFRPTKMFNGNPRVRDQRVSCSSGDFPSYQPIFPNLWIQDTTGRVVEVSGIYQDRAVQFYNEFKRNDIAVPVPLDEIQIQFVVSVPSRGSDFLCNVSTLNPGVSCNPYAVPGATVELLTRTYKQGEATNVRDEPAPGEPDQDTYLISLSNPITASDPNIPAPSQFMSKTVTSTKSTSYAWSSESTVSLKVGVKVGIKAGGGASGVASVEKTVEGSFDAQYDRAWGQTSTTVNEYSETYQVTLEAPAGTCVQLQLSNRLRSADVPWEGTFESRGYVSAYHVPANADTGALPVRRFLQDIPLEELIDESQRIYHTFGDLKYRQQLVKQATVIRLPASKCAAQLAE